MEQIALLFTLGFMSSAQCVVCGYMYTMHSGREGLESARWKRGGGEIGWIGESLDGPIQGFCCCCSWLGVAGL